jgi:hypothetical protein
MYNINGCMHETSRSPPYSDGHAANLQLRQQPEHKTSLHMYVCTRGLTVVAWQHAPKSSGALHCCITSVAFAMTVVRVMMLCGCRLRCCSLTRSSKDTRLQSVSVSMFGNLFYQQRKSMMISWLLLWHHCSRVSMRPVQVFLIVLHRAVTRKI